MEQELMEFLMENQTEQPELLIKFKCKPEATLKAWAYYTESQWISLYGATGIGIFNVLNKYRSDPSKQVITKFPTIQNPLVDAAYEQYMEDASRLAQYPQVDKVVSIMHDVELKYFVTKKGFPPFIFIDGSSGVGKTQMAFTLMNRLKAERSVYYMLASDVNQQSQLIYQRYQGVSYALTMCVEKDLTTLSEKKLSCNNFLNEKLYCFGFILQLLQKSVDSYHVDLNQISIDPCWALDVLDVLKRFKALPVIIIDEFFTEDRSIDDQYQKCRLLLNMLRSLAMCVVIMGTNTSATNMLDSSIQNRNSGLEIEWCHLVTEMPPTHPSLIDQLPGCISDSIKNLVVNSRPWFARLALSFFKQQCEDEVFQKLSDVDKCDSMCKSLFAAVTQAKSVFRDASRSHGQVCMLFDMFYALDMEPEQTIRSSLVHHHFALNYPLHNTLLLLGDEELLCGTERWRSLEKYPVIDQDLLLYLCMSGGKGFSPFMSLTRRCEEQRRVSYQTFRETLRDLDQRRGFAVHSNNSVQQKPNFHDFEGDLAAAIVVSSHVGGVGGVGIEIFLSNVVYELSLGQSEYKLLEFGPSLKLKNNLKELLIPFMAPPNQIWPRSMLQNQSNRFRFANCTQPRDSAQVDFECTDGKVSGECKDRQKVDFSLCISLIQEMPYWSVLHLVLLRNMPKKFSESSEAKATLKAAKGDRKMSFTKVCLSDPELKVEPVRGLTSDDHCDVAVVFIVVSG
ncbi:hypothetical protein MIR68_008471 [Amoeboaphelidium protococcarum]|nr:hypothetical protein MIR68_008471 [Amoeboaphelidium protococcarum]